MSVTHPPGLIGVLSTDLSRWAWFSQSLMQLHMPTGTHMEWVMGYGIPAAVNRIIEALEPEDRWLCLLADDHIFPGDMLMRLLDHQVPIVAPLVCLRRLPYLPSLFHATDRGYVGYSWGELAGKTGLLPVDTMGGPGVVIRREVIEALAPPWFESLPGSRVNQQDELYFFTKCLAQGFQPYVDLDLPIGHCLPAAVFPEQLPSQAYGVRLWSHDDLALLRPQPRMEMRHAAAD